MMTVEQFLSSVGRQDFRKALDLTDQSLTRAVNENVMPAGWYLGARKISAEKGVHLPEHLFRWRDVPQVAS